MRPDLGHMRIGRRCFPDHTTLMHHFVPVTKNWICFRRHTRFSSLEKSVSLVWLLCHLKNLPDYYSFWNSLCHCSLAQLFWLCRIHLQFSFISVTSSANSIFLYVNNCKISPETAHLRMEGLEKKLASTDMTEKDERAASPASTCDSDSSDDSFHSDLGEDRGVPDHHSDNR